MSQNRGPVVIELAPDDAPIDPAAAPPIADPGDAAPPGDGTPARGVAMQTAARMGARRPSPLAGLFTAGLAGLAGVALGVALWDFLTALLARNAVLGAGALILALLAAGAGAILAAREILAWRGLRRLDGLRRGAEAALGANDLAAMRRFVARLDALYAPRPELAAARHRLGQRQAELLDAAGLADLTEAELLAPLDAEARRAVEAASRQVATVTALVPLALADVAAALLCNLRMIRRIAEVYGGRAGVLGGWRLTRTVLAHLVATGALAVGDDLVTSVAGGGMLARVSRRFGEGVVNGALTARVGIAAIEVCRPLPFRTLPPPRLGSLLQRALAGVFDRR